MDGDRAGARGGRRLLVDRAERDRPRAGDLPAAVGGRATRSRSTASRTSTAASQLVELRFVPDWARTIARRVLYEAADEIRLAALKASSDEAVAGLAAKIDREEAYHRMHARDVARAAARRAALRRWRSRSSGRTRSGSSRPSSATELAERASSCPSATPVERGAHDDELAGALGGDDRGAPLGPGGGVVTAEEVWAALAEVEDPEIPVISLVDLGVVRDVQVDGERVHVEFTPTFLGCPALEVMRDADGGGDRGARRRARRRGRPRRLVVDRQDHAGGPREAPRRRLRPAGARARRRRRSSSSSRARSSAAPTAARPRRSWRTSSARPRAGRSATARAAASRSSSSRRSSQLRVHGRLPGRASRPAR